MGENRNGNAAAMHTAMNAVQALGRGFDVNFDTRLLYCKGVTGSRIVEIDEEHGRDIYLDDQTVLPNISRDIKNSQEPIGRHSSGVCNFHEMVEYFNKKANVSNAFPLGSFNSAFNFTGSTNIDAATTKILFMDGFTFHLPSFSLQSPHWYCKKMLNGLSQHLGTHHPWQVSLKILGRMSFLL